MQSIKLSDFPDETYIMLEKKKREEICDKLEKKFGYLIRAFYEIGLSVRLEEFKLGFSKSKKVKRYISLVDLKKICKTINIEINKLQKCVKRIKTSSRSGVIKNPKLPLRVIPEMFAILGHMLSDGYGGEVGRSVYVNTSKEARENFIKKLKKAFGDVYYSTNPNHSDYVGISKLVPKILKKYFGIKDFRSGKAYLTSKVFNAPRKHLIELVKAIIIDEGRIGDSEIQIEFSATPQLTKDTLRICKRFGYSYYISKNSFLIKCESFPKIKKDMENFIIPHKQERFLRWFIHKNRGWYNRYKGITKKEIIKLTLEKPSSIRELSYKLNLKSSSVRNQISGYNLKGKRIKGLFDLGILKIKNEGRYDERIYEIKDINKAQSFLEGRL